MHEARLGDPVVPTSACAAMWILCPGTNAQEKKTICPMLIALIRAFVGQHLGIGVSTPGSSESLLCCIAGAQLCSVGPACEAGYCQ